MGEESILIKGFGARRGSQVVRPGTANPLFAGSIPARASILLRIIPPRTRASPFQVLHACGIVDWPSLRANLLSLRSGYGPRLHSPADHSTRSRASPFQELNTCGIVDWPSLRASLHSPAELLELYTRKLLIKGKSEWNDLKRNCIQSICPREKGPR